MRWRSSPAASSVKVIAAMDLGAAPPGEQHHHPPGEQRRLSRACGSFDQKRPNRSRSMRGGGRRRRLARSCVLQNLESPPQRGSNAMRLRRSYPGEAEAPIEGRSTCRRRAFRVPRSSVQYGHHLAHEVADSHESPVDILQSDLERLSGQ